ncbi:MAG: hypothetical protein EOP49_09995 [Sphingobacteriales bacterium]|nr:MAG: hypothetical protein EOP49_09995 [Sphingobacteriales bacterium]
MKRKTILAIFIALIVVAAAGVAFVWNKPHATVENEQAVAITAEQLTNEFISNEQQANATYLNKVVEVSGTVEEVSQNQDNKTVILLKSDDPLSGVQCTLKDVSTPAVGDQIKVKGFCNGYTTVVLLTESVIVK